MAIREHTREQAEGAAEQLKRGRDEARGIGIDIGEIAEDLKDLANAEMRLAQAEAKENVGYLVKGAIWGGVAAIHAVLLMAFVFVTIMFVLNIWLELWASALITTGIILVLTAAVGGLAYQAFKRFSVKPERTMESIKEDMRWLKSLATSNGR